MAIGPTIEGGAKLRGAGKVMGFTGWLNIWVPNMGPHTVL